MINQQNLSKLGIGGWGIGGFAEKDPDNDDQKQIKALVHQFNQGINLTEINFWNSQGHSAQLIKQALDASSLNREDILLVQAIYNYNLPTLEDVKKELELCLITYKTDYVDVIEFPLTSFDFYGFDELIQLIKQFISDGKVRFVSVTNFDLANLKKIHQIFGEKLFSHELHYSFEVRELEDLGILKYGFENDIINVIYQPLRRNRTAQRNWPLLVELAKKYGKTQNQIILNWMTARSMHPLVKSETIKHIDENLQALEFEMDSEDLERLTNFRVPDYKPQEIDWLKKDDGGIFVAQLPNVFDELHPTN